jgi:long-chain fatty acid omega-monooxygenase
MDVLLGDGIFNADGDLWRKQRKTASFEFASKNLRDLSTKVFREYGLKLSNIICQASVDGRVTDMQVAYLSFFFSNISELLYLHAAINLGDQAKRKLGMKFNT